MKSTRRVIFVQIVVRSSTPHCPFVMHALFVTEHLSPCSANMRWRLQRSQLSPHRTITLHACAQRSEIGGGGGGSMNLVLLVCPWTKTPSCRLSCVGIGGLVLIPHSTLNGYTVFIFMFSVRSTHKVCTRGRIWLMAMENSELRK